MASTRGADGRADATGKIVDPDWGADRVAAGVKVSRHNRRCLAGGGDDVVDQSSLGRPEHLLNGPQAPATVIQSGPGIASVPRIGATTTSANAAPLVRRNATHRPSGENRAVVTAYCGCCSSGVA